MRCAATLVDVTRAGSEASYDSDEGPQGWTDEIGGLLHEWVTFDLWGLWVLLEGC